MKIKYVLGEVYYHRRLEDWVKQQCPFNDKGCGEWCPLHWVYAEPDGYLELVLCHNRVPIEMVVKHDI